MQRLLPRAGALDGGLPRASTASSSETSGFLASQAHLEMEGVGRPTAPSVLAEHQASGRSQAKLSSTDSLGPCFVR